MSELPDGLPNTCLDCDDEVQVFSDHYTDQDGIQNITIKVVRGDLSRSKRVTIGELMAPVITQLTKALDT